MSSVYDLTILNNPQGGKGKWAAYYIGPQSFIITVSYSLIFVGQTTLGTFIYFDWLVNLVECPNISITNCNLKKG